MYLIHMLDYVKVVFAVLALVLLFIAVWYCLSNAVDLNQAKAQLRLSNRYLVLFFFLAAAWIVIPSTRTALMMEARESFKNSRQDPCMEGIMLLEELNKDG